MLRSTLFLIASIAGFAQDPREIVRRSIQTDDRNAQLLQDYIYVQNDVEHELDGKGGVKATHMHKREVMFIGGKPYRRLLEKDGKPLGASEEKAEKEKLDKAMAAASRQSPGERAARLEEYRRKRTRDREQLRSIPDALNFNLLREERRDGRDVYVIQAEPRPDYRGKHHELLTKMHGTLWIDKADYHWVRVEAETLDTISFGFFLARLSKGTRIEFESRRMNDEVWVPSRASFNASARLVFKKLNADREITFSNYRKFQTDSRIISTSEIENK